MQRVKRNPGIKPGFCHFKGHCLSVELIFFGGTGQGGHRGLATLNDGGHLVEVTGTHFLLVCHEGVAPLGGGKLLPSPRAYW